MVHRRPLRFPENTRRPAGDYLDFARIRSAIHRRLLRQPHRPPDQLAMKTRPCRLLSLTSGFVDLTKTFSDPRATTSTLRTRSAIRRRLFQPRVASPTRTRLDYKTSRGRVSHPSTFAPRSPPTTSKRDGIVHACIHLHTRMYKKRPIVMDVISLR